MIVLGIILLLLGLYCLMLAAAGTGSFFNLGEALVWLVIGLVFVILAVIVFVIRFAFM